MTLVEMQNAAESLRVCREKKAKAEATLARLTAREAELAATLKKGEALVSGLLDDVKGA